MSLRALQPACFAALQRTLFLRGRDITAELASGPLLVIAPHPDDETLGCGAAIMRATDAGRPVRIVVVCDGRHSQQSASITPSRLAQIRRDEVVEACRRLGVPAENVTSLGFEDRRIAATAREVAGRIEPIIADFAPANILAPSGIDKHPDHRALHAIIARMVERGRLTRPVYEYPIWFWTARTWMTPTHPAPRRAAELIVRTLRTAALSRPVLVSTDGLLDRKRHALDAFNSQLRNITGEPGWPVLDPAFLANFFRRHELLFPLLGAGAPARAQPADDPTAIRSGGLGWGWAEDPATP